jgi:hypothetical protein
MNLAFIKRPITSCNKPVIKLVTTSECVDSITDDNYGTGTVIDGSNGVSPFPFYKVTNLRGFVKNVPREIVRQNSRNCKPQKVSSSIVYEIQGADFYPGWKMRELEDMFHAKTINIDGQDVLYYGGRMFEEVGKFCTPVYRLVTNVQECEKSQIYGCGNECAPNCFYFLLPANVVTQNFFNEAGQQIASTYQQLLDWYASQSNVQEAVDINASLQIACQYFKVFKVVGTGYIPAFLFYDSPSQSNKVYGMTLDCSLPDYSKLCGGVDNRSCGQLQIEPPVVFELTCGDVTIGDVVVFVVGQSCSIAPFPAWVQHTGDTSITSVGSTRTLDLSVFNPTYIVTDPEENYWVIVVGLEPNLCELEAVGVPIGIPVTQVKVDGVFIDDSLWEYDPITRIMTFTPCLEIGQEVTLVYLTGGASPTFSNELIANITGSSCLPSTMLYFNNASNPEIPAGATLTIDTLGNIKWTGSPTSADGTGTVIEVENIIYNV